MSGVQYIYIYVGRDGEGMRNGEGMNVVPLDPLGGETSGMGWDGEEGEGG